MFVDFVSGGAQILLASSKGGLVSKSLRTSGVDDENGFIG